MFVFMLVYLVSGCDLLPSTFNMPLKRVFPFAMAALHQGQLFETPLVREDRAGERRVGKGDGVKLMATCCV